MPNDKPLLTLLDLKKPFEVHYDACGKRLGALFLQEERPISYKTWHFYDKEKIFCIYEKEFLVVIHAL